MTVRALGTGCGALALAALLGCAGPLNAAGISSGAEYVCRHCNCIMPAGVDPEAECPVCNCGMKSRDCRRGW